MHEDNVDHPSKELPEVGLADSKVDIHPQKEPSLPLPVLLRRGSYRLQIPKAPVLLKSPTTIKDSGSFNIIIPETLSFDADEGLREFSGTIGI